MLDQAALGFDVVVYATVKISTHDAQAAAWGTRVALPQSGLRFETGPAGLTNRGNNGRQWHRADEHWISPGLRSTPPAGETIITNWIPSRR